MGSCKIPTWRDTAEAIRWEVSRSADLTLVLYVTDPDNGNAPVDLSGYTFEGVIKADATNASPVLKTLTVVGTIAGEIIAEIAFATFDLSPDSYVFSIWETAPDREPWLQGPLIVSDNMI